MLLFISLRERWNIKGAQRLTRGTAIHDQHHQIKSSSFCKSLASLLFLVTPEACVSNRHTVHCCHVLLNPTWNFSYMLEGKIVIVIEGVLVLNSSGAKKLEYL